MPAKKLRPNLLGSLSAEADTTFLNDSFFESNDYRTLIETSDRIVVVGRRGTGKSALTIALDKYWNNLEQAEVIKIVPEDFHIIGFRPLLKLFGDNFNIIRAGSRIAWKYSFLIEASLYLSRHYSFKQCAEFDLINEHLSHWPKSDKHIVNKIKERILPILEKYDSPEDRIGHLPIELDLTKIENAVINACSNSPLSVVYLIDNLDVGYEPNDLGVGFLDGLVQAAIDCKNRIENFKVTVFLRDNIFRSIQAKDEDFSRNIEGSVLRLHWDEKLLLSFLSLRLKSTFGLDAENSLRIWNAVTVGELQGDTGFKTCLKHTLYRPRDLLSLLNESFRLASNDNQDKLTIGHIDQAAKVISNNRLQDLIKEYESVLPGIRSYISAFTGRSKRRDVDSLIDNIQVILSDGSIDPLVQQDFDILENADSVIRGLYSVGFLGLNDEKSGNYIFCHDGRAPDKSVSIGDSVLVHPCYWIALDLNDDEVIDQSDLEEIFDDYDIDVLSETPKIRKERIKEIIKKLDQINEGSDDAADFELWCQQAIRICFAKSLKNVQLKPNRKAKFRRDIVATNLCADNDDAWSRILNDYGTRQVTIEVKNYQELKADDYQQVLSYLNKVDEYGRFAIFITRAEDQFKFSDADIESIREYYKGHKILVIRLTAKFLTILLSKLINPPHTFDPVNHAMNKILDNYSRLYTQGQNQMDAESRRRSRKGKNLRRKQRKSNRL